MAKVGRPRKSESRTAEIRDREYCKALSHPLIRPFDDTFWIIPHDGGYCLYDRTRYCKRANAQYLGKFYISSGSDRYVFRDEYYEDAKSLICAMDKYNATLPFSPEIYDPTYRKNCQIEMASYDYLTSLGFKKLNDLGIFKDIFILNDAYEQKICELEIETVKDTTRGVVRRWIYQNKWDGKVIEVPFINLETAIGAINSQLANYTMLLHAQLLNLYEDMTKERATIVLDNTYDKAKGTSQYKDARQKTIEYLEKELKRLKGEQYERIKGENHREGY